jgi:predicted outer membrane repeat protein
MNQPTFGAIALMHSVTIDGAGSGVTITADPDIQLFTVGGSAQVAFMNLGLQGVNITSNNVTALGGAIYSNSTGPLSFTNVTFLNNVTNGIGFSSGGAIYLEPQQVASTPPLTIMNCTFIGNHADLSGGAIFAKGPMTITGSTFIGNTTSGHGNGDDGGAIYDGDPVSSAQGQPGIVTVTDSTFSGNQNTSLQGGGDGGAIGANDVIATNVTFVNNLAAAGGAVSMIHGANSTFTNVTFSGNFATTEGGALLNETGATALTNVTISGNRGGSNVPGSTVGGGGISIQTGTVTLTNTIVAGNSFVNQTNSDLNGPFTSGGNNLIGVGDGSTGLTNNANGDIVGTFAAPIDPHLGPLGSNGGATQTMPLLAASPAIGAGNATACKNAPVAAKDQRGLPRLATICDIGAYESQGKTYVLAVNPPTVPAGTPFSFTVTMEDSFGDVLTRYTGTVHFTSDDPNATLPADYPFTTGAGNDNGQHAFSVTLKTPGPHTITVTDTQAPTLSATKVNIPVVAGTPASIVVNANTTPQSTLVGTNFGVPLSVTVKDAAGNPVPGAVVTFTPPATGASGTFVGGVNTATTNASGIATAANFTANAIPGVYGVNASVSGVGQPAVFALTNLPAGIVVSVTTLPVGTVNHAYSVTLTASGGTAPYTFAVTNGTLPNGLSLSSGGVLSGTPTSAGQSTFTVTATDVYGSSGNQSYTLTVGTTTLTSIIVIAPPSVRVGGTVAVRAVGGFSDGSTQDLTASVQWTSSDTTKAIVDAAGNVTGVSPGSATVTATTNAISGHATITIPGGTALGIAPVAAPGSRPGGATTGASGQTPAPPPVPSRPSGGSGGPTPNPVPTGR